MKYMYPVIGVKLILELFLQYIPVFKTMPNSLKVIKQNVVSIVYDNFTAPKFVHEINLTRPNITKYIF